MSEHIIPGGGLPVLPGHLSANPTVPLLVCHNLSKMKRTISISEGSNKRMRKSVSKASSSRAKGVSMKRFNTTTITRSITQSGGVNLQNGWTGGVASGYDITIEPTLQNCSFIVAGTTAYQPVMPNVTELTNLYDQYRIKRVYIEVWCSATEHGTGTPTAGLPLIHYANDYNSTGAFNINDILQYPDMKTRQLGGVKPIKWSFVPRIRSDVLTQGGLLSTSALNTTGWIDTTSASVAHLGTKILINPQGLSTNISIGQMTIVVRYDIEFRFVK